ncbi:MAG TPA: diguanylate cyclase [Thermodesulfobacteriota bacterium]|nr:diguanylate cyclase [Thermodesulfobacteriota bacterium]
MENLTYDQPGVGKPSEKSRAQMRGAINKQQPTAPTFFGLMMGHLSHLPKSLLIAAGFVMVPLVGILNHIAGPQLSLTIFYMIPIALVAWFTERWFGFIFSILSALVWLVVDLTSGAAYSSSDIPYWNGLARLGSLFIFTFILSTLKKSLKQEKEYSRTDFLTGIRNRRYFIELVDMEINRTRRYGHPFTIASIDLDHFKIVNDCFGHSTGDILLRLVALTIQGNIRITDMVARLGGDEFAILLPETGRNAAEVILQKVQKTTLDILQTHAWPVTLSIGVVTFTSPPSTVDETLRISDRLMYSAKNDGKNRIQYDVFGARG